MKYVIILALVILPLSLFSMDNGYGYTKYQNVQEASQEMPSHKGHHSYTQKSNYKPRHTTQNDAAEEVYEKNW